MFPARLFRKPKVVTCASCGRVIDPRESRTVEKNRRTKAERHTHLDCRKRQDDPPV